MTAQEHLAALKRSIDKLSSVRGEIEAVQKLGEKTVAELDVLNSAESPDADQVAMLAHRLRGLAAKKAALAESKTQAEAALESAVESAFSDVDKVAQCSDAIDAAAAAVLPWCKGSLEDARKAALKLPAFTERAQQVSWLHLRRGKVDAEETVPLLNQFFESVAGAPPVAEVAA